jgi:hypothetical protein
MRPRIPPLEMQHEHACVFQGNSREKQGVAQSCPDRWNVELPCGDNVLETA